MVIHQLKGEHREKQPKLLVQIILPTLLTVLKNNKKVKPPPPVELSRSVGVFLMPKYRFVFSLFTGQNSVKSPVFALL